MRILLVNPNTSTESTAALAALAREAAAPETVIVEATGAFGATLMLSQAEQTIGAHALLDAIACHGEDCDAVIVAAFGDYGVQAAAELFGVPAVSLMDAAFTTLRWLGQPFSIVVVDAVLAPALRAAAKLHGCEHLIRDIHGVGCPPDSPQFASTAADLVRGLDTEKADLGLLVGPPLLARQTELKAVSPLPLIDPVSCAVRAAELAARAFGTEGVRRTPDTDLSTGNAIGLSEPLMRALARRRKAGL